MGVLCLSSQYLGGGKLGDPGIQGQPGLREILFKINKPEVKKVGGGDTEWQLLGRKGKRTASWAIVSVLQDEKVCSVFT